MSSASSGSSSAGSASSGSGAWLIGIDLQRIFQDPASAWAVPRFGEALDGTEELLPSFEGRTLLTRFVAPHAPTGAWLAYYRDWPFALLPEDDPLYRLAGDLGHRELPVESRTTFGKWDAALAEAIGGASEVVLTGVSTDCCVLSTALAAADAGIHVRVVTDACAGATDADHRRALDAMALYTPLIELTTVAEVRAPEADQPAGS